VRQYAQKFPEDIPSEGDLDYLKSLLRGWNFDSPQLIRIINQEREVQSYANFKSLITRDNPNELKAFANRLLDLYGENYKSQLQNFNQLLDDMQTNLDRQKVAAVIAELKRARELRNFETRLFSEEPITTIEDVDCLTGFQFEVLLSKVFEKKGYEVERTKLSGDQGADLVVVKFGERMVVQAKCYSSKVGNSAIQEVVAAINHYHAGQGMVVTNNYFTRAAKELARSNRVQLIERDELKDWIRNYL